MSTLDRYVQNTADIKARRSKMPLNHRVLLSYFHGYLQPVSIVEVLPGDTMKANLSVLTRMSTPIVPIMDNIRQEVDAFFVPKRILWNKTKQFYGEAESFGVATKVDEPYGTNISGNAAYMLSRSYTISPVSDANLFRSESFAHAFDLIYDAALTNFTGVNVLPVRAFLAIYNEFYRDQNYQDQYKWDKEASGNIGSVGFAYRGTDKITATDLLPKVNKDKDVFVSILPWAQKGDPVSLSVGQDVPVVGSFSADIIPDGYLALEAIPSDPQFGPVDLELHPSTNIAVGDSGALKFKNIGGHYTNENDDVRYLGGLAVGDSQVDLVAKTSQMAAITVSSLIYALAYQDFLAKLAKGGSKYREYIYTMFGTTIADATEDIPEYLGSLKMRINVNQVLQTTGFDASASSELGATGAYSVSGNSKDMFTKSFTEPGYLVFVSYTKHQRTYSSGIDKMYLKHELLDYYQPPFANISDVPIGSWELYAGGENEPLGFQEPWYEYRSIKDKVRGILNPMNPNSLSVWTLADAYANKPFIGDTFIQEDRDAIARCLTTGTTGPDYIMDFDIRIDATRVMPLFSSGRIGSL